MAEQCDDRREADHGVEYETFHNPVYGFQTNTTCQFIENKTHCFLLKNKL